jgi:hypothetical protein
MFLSTTFCEIGEVHGQPIGLCRIEMRELQNEPDPFLRIGFRYPPNPKIAHAMTASPASTAKTTMTMSTALLSCSRNGLKPTASTVTGRVGCLLSPE